MARISTARYRAKHLQRGRTGAARGRRAAPAAPGSRAVRRMVVCGVIFVLLVAVKLLFPQTIGRVAQSVGQLLGRDADFKEAFAAVGRAVSGEEPVGESLQDAYTAVFSPTGVPDAQDRETVGAVDTECLRPGARYIAYIAPKLPAREPQPAQEVEISLPETAAEGVSGYEEKSPEPSGDDTTTTEALSYVYTMPALPDNASLEQRNLGFTHQSPILGSLSSTFGWREHPIDGGNKFHYGVDLAADTGTDIRAFADGTVYATGESSTLGNYVMLQHEGGYITLYAHCSKVTVIGGSVSMGDKIAEVGSTGAATGPHLHFELHDGDLYLNPIYYVEIQ